MGRMDEMERDELTEQTLWPLAVVSGARTTPSVSDFFLMGDRRLATA
jgi:hypothetical protein